MRDKTRLLLQEEQNGSGRNFSPSGTDTHRHSKMLGKKKSARFPALFSELSLHLHISSIYCYSLDMDRYENRKNKSPESGMG